MSISPSSLDDAPPRWSLGGGGNGSVVIGANGTYWHDASAMGGTIRPVISNVVDVDLHPANQAGAESGISPGSPPANDELVRSQSCPPPRGRMAGRQGGWGLERQY